MTDGPPKSEPTAEERAWCEAQCARFNAAPYYQLLGMRAESARPGESCVRVRFDPKLMQSFGSVHGGVLMTVADSAIGIAVVTTIGPDEAAATVDIAVQFQSPPGPNDVVAEGRVTRRGGKLAFGECVVRAADRVIARAQGVLCSGPASRLDRSGGQAKTSGQRSCRGRAPVPSWPA